MSLATAIEHPGAQDAAVTDLSVVYYAVSPKTSWVFLRLTLSNGVEGFGEATFFGMEQGIAAKVEGYAGSLRGLSIREGMRWLEDRLFRDFDELPRVALCGIGQALLDAQARHLGVCATDIIGGPRRDGVPVYANINRGTKDRTPEGWAARARLAVGHGHRALKLAPFDGVRSSDMDAPETRRNLRAGIDAVLAVRDAVGPDIRINVDFHGRFTASGAFETLRQIAPAAPYWIEMPVPEGSGYLDEARRLRLRAGDMGIRLAGAELIFGLGTVRTMIEAGAYDVYMPDLRFCGGIFEATRMSALVARAGLEFSLHNPAGPLLDLVSLQVARACPSITMIEHQFQEDPKAAQLLDPALPAPAEGLVHAPDGPGWGAVLRIDRIDEADRRLPPPVDNLGLPGAGNMS
ncbi:mandelate racemase/muconate lactonizing enzyme family protein [Oceaniglobus trochenteri]|uniref:mandelate racemase/muconate lactonizing enzyme family protein n=1 Tax=Oceaniglobus trochenteri TaxID=2763260 RepID=UPI001CFFFF4B|nr:mandelate racemase/muconate lactonizing enzyme family protein [Oceaniglobus trochenteri]